MASGLAGFAGVKRRFEFVGMWNNVAVYDDYAHHPTEIFATISSVAAITTGRIFILFQLHRYSRTALLWNKFVNIFTKLLSDTNLSIGLLVIAGIYSAGEKKIDGISAGKMVKEINAKLFESDGKLVPSVGWENFPFAVSCSARVESVEEILSNFRFREEDIILTLGAGTMNKIAAELVERSKKRKSAVLN